MPLRLKRHVDTNQKFIQPPQEMALHLLWEMLGTSSKIWNVQAGRLKSPPKPQNNLTKNKCKYIHLGKTIICVYPCMLSALIAVTPVNLKLIGNGPVIQGNCWSVYSGFSLRDGFIYHHNKLLPLIGHNSLKRQSV